MQQIWKYIQSDYFHYTGKVLNPFKLFMYAIFVINHCFRIHFG